MPTFVSTVTFESDRTGVFEKNHSPENQVVLATKAFACSKQNADQR